MRFRIFILALLSLLLAGCPKQEPEGEFIHKEFHTPTGTLPYRFYIPETQQGELPLIVFLHGAGEFGSDNTIQTRNFPPGYFDSKNLEQYPAYILAPQCQENDPWARFPWYPQTDTTNYPTSSMEMTIALIEECLKTYRIDPDRVYVIGTSLGGEGVYSMASFRPDLMAAAVPICGLGDPKKAETMADVPFWIFHGELDDITSVEYARAMHSALSAAGADVRYTEYPEEGHLVWYRVYEDEQDLYTWMFSQSRN